MISDARAAQLLTLDLLKEFIRLCEENGLRYYMIGGSLIGVLRHRGFIPWDDDVDIGMPRRDYDRFLEIVSAQEDFGYGVCTWHNDPAWHFAFCQFVDLQTEIEIGLAEQTRRAHLWVDVFPLDGLPAQRGKRKRHVNRIMRYRYLIQLANIATQVDIHRKRPWYESAILHICKALPMRRLIKTDKTLLKLEKTLRRYDFDTSLYAGNLLGRYRKREIVPKEYFGEPQKAPFEDIFVNIPQESDKLQTALYGNYMELPPEDQREGHYVKIIKTREKHQ